jgi:hypothetical protein
VGSDEPLVGRQLAGDAEGPAAGRAAQVPRRRLQRREEQHRGGGRHRVSWRGLPPRPADGGEAHTVSRGGADPGEDNADQVVR